MHPPYPLQRGPERLEMRWILPYLGDLLVYGTPEPGVLPTELTVVLFELW